MDRVSADFKDLDQDLRETLMMNVMPATKNHTGQKLLAEVEAAVRITHDDDNIVKLARERGQA
jgi:hypothetical protein